MGNFFGHVKCQHSWASTAHAGALCVFVGNVIVLCAGDTLGVCYVVTAVFHCTTLAGNVGTTLGFTGLTVHDDVIVADGGAVGDIAGVA